MDYVDAMAAEGVSARGRCARTKQLLQTWRAGGLIEDEGDRSSWLRETDSEAFLARLRAEHEAPAA